jgi:hypothetical protein
MQFLQELMYAGLWAINAYGNYRLSAPKVLIERPVLVTEVKMNRNDQVPTVEPLYRHFCQEDTAQSYNPQTHFTLERVLLTTSVDCFSLHIGCSRLQALILNFFCYCYRTFQM